MDFGVGAVGSGAFGKILIWMQLGEFGDLAVFFNRNTSQKIWFGFERLHVDQLYLSVFGRT